MALTVDTTAPIVPMASATSGGMTCTLAEIVCKASEVYRVGDIVVMASGLADRVDAAHADDVILGVCVQAKTAGSAVSSDDTIKLALAFPGQIFTGSMVGGAATNHTPNATAATEAAFLIGTRETVLGTDSYSAFVMLNSAVATGQCAVFRYSQSQMRGQTFKLGQTTPVNPRVDFTFRNSFFHQLTASS